MSTEVMGDHFNAATRFFTIFAAICPLTSSSLAIVVLHFEIPDVEVSSPLTKPVEWPTTATVAAEHALLLALAKT